MGVQHSRLACIARGFSIFTTYHSTIRNRFRSSFSQFRSSFSQVLSIIRRISSDATSANYYSLPEPYQ